MATSLNILVVAVLVGCQSGSAQPSPPPPPRDAAGVDADPTTLAPKAAYVALCAPCHGANGQGYVADHAPSLVNPTFLESASDDFLHRSIALGRPGTSMAGYGKARGGPLDDATIDRIVGYLRAQGPKPKPLAPPGAGDPARGGPLYAKLCLTCHGDAKTRGEAPHLANAQFLSMASDAFIRYAIVSGRPGTKMLPFPALTGAQIDDIVAYVRDPMGRPVVPPPPEQLPPPTGKEPLVINPGGKDPSFQLTGPSGGAGEKKYVSAAQVVKALQAKQRLVIIDARSPSDWMRVHIPGTVSIPYFDMKRLAELPKDGPWVVAYCACPHHLSGIVVDELRKRGYTHSAVLDEGILEWHRRGYPVVAAPGVTAPPKEPPPLPPGSIQ